MIKMRTLFPKRLVVAVFALVVTQSALGFYNPSTGRWLSRDPIGELAFGIFSGFEFASKAWWGFEGGMNNLQDSVEHMNPFTFVGNAPNDFIDGIGLYKLVNKRHIRPDRCEIVIIYGHSKRTSDLWIWHMNNTPSAGAVITCFPGANIQGLGDDNLWKEAEEIRTELVWWLPMADVAPIDMDEVPRNKYRDINAHAAMYRQVLPKAANKVGEFCKVCKQVTVTFIRVRKGGSIVPNPTGKSDDPGWPNIPSSIIPCSGGGSGVACTK